MKLYVANCSRQNHIVNFQPPERATYISLPIAAGAQALLGDYGTAAIDAITAHLASFGARPINDALKDEGVVALAWSTERPASADAVFKIAMRNQNVLRERGVELRRRAAVAANNAVDNVGGVREFEMTIQEENPVAGEKAVDQGYRVTKNASSPPPVPDAPRRRSRRAA
jgi:hypothetical protein